MANNLFRIWGNCLRTTPFSYLQQKKKTRKDRNNICRYAKSDKRYVHKKRQKKDTQWHKTIIKKTKLKDSSWLDSLLYIRQTFKNSPAVNVCVRERESEREVPTWEEKKKEFFFLFHFLWRIDRFHSQLKTASVRSVRRHILKSDASFFILWFGFFHFVLSRIKLTFTFYYCLK